MEYYLVRYGAMRSVATFKYEDGILVTGQKVIARTERGLEVGRVVNRIKLDAQEAEASRPGQILRKVNAEDRERLRVIDDEQAPAELRFAREKAVEFAIAMKVVHVEHLLSGDRIIFYFLANGRVDFRKLVRELARTYQTHIELKQIGVRDEARLLADYEHCGRQLCCRAWIKHLQPVTMKLAKNQKATLDPAKISGGCGRLMCCLRYEDKTYEDLRKGLPPRKSYVVTADGEGEVVDFDILSRTVVVQDASGGRFLVQADQIKEVKGRAPIRKEAPGPAGPAADKGPDAGRRAQRPGPNQPPRPNNPPGKERPRDR
jgi:cell fate regulator YaaT (PSP1 superfamily)